MNPNPRLHPLKSSQALEGKFCCFVPSLSFLSSLNVFVRELIEIRPLHDPEIEIKMKLEATPIIDPEDCVISLALKINARIQMMDLLLQSKSR